MYTCVLPLCLILLKPVSYIHLYILGIQCNILVFWEGWKNQRGRAASIQEFNHFNWWWLWLDIDRHEKYHHVIILSWQRYFIRHIQ